MSNEYKDWQRDNAVDAKIAEVKSLQSQLHYANSRIEDGAFLIKGYQEELDRARKRIGELEEKLRWIPVEDRLPEKAGDWSPEINSLPAEYPIALLSPPSSTFERAKDPMALFLKPSVKASKVSVPTPVL